MKPIITCEGCKRGPCPYHRSGRVQFGNCMVPKRQERKFDVEDTETDSKE